MEYNLTLPDGIKVKHDGENFVVSGKLGEVSKKMFHPDVKVEIKDGEIILSSKLDNRNAKKILKTFISILKNMFNGVQEGYTYNLKVVYVHFPITVKTQDNKVIIENFLGERVPRKANIIPGANVKIDKQEIIITGIDLDAVSQTAGNIERATRIVAKDRRVFQDGIYITKKAE